MIVIVLKVLEMAGKIYLKKKQPCTLNPAVYVFVDSVPDIEKLGSGKPCTYSQVTNSVSG